MRIGKHQLNATSVINIAGALFVAYLMVLLVQTINRNYSLERQISQQTAQVALLNAQKDQLSYQLKYYGTTSYQERQAHSQLGLVKPGETEVVLPSPSPTPPASDATTAKTAHKSNWSQWLSFLGGGN